jgi:hypothetical protein
MRNYIGWMDRRNPIPRDKEQDYQDAGRAIEACLVRAVQQGQTNWREISRDIEVAIAGVSDYLGERLKQGEQIRNIWVHYRRKNKKPPGSVMDYFKKV